MASFSISCDELKRGLVFRIKAPSIRSGRVMLRALRASEASWEISFAARQRQNIHKWFEIRVTILWGSGIVGHCDGDRSHQPQEEVTFSIFPFLPAEKRPRSLAQLGIMANQCHAAEIYRRVIQGEDFLLWVLEIPLSLLLNFKSLPSIEL